MEFEKGKYYEVVSNIGTTAIFQYLWVNTFVITYCDDKHLIGLDSKLDKEDKVVNTFNNIHEVSARIKEIEEKQKFVGLIYECDRSNLSIGDYDHSIVEVVEANYITEQGFDGKVKILKNISVNEVNEEDKHEYKEGNILEYSVMFEYSKELTQEQYEQRLKELGREEINMWDWVIVPDESGQYDRSDVGSVVGWTYKKNNFVVKWLYGERVYIAASELQKIPELDAICLLTGNRNYELVDDDHDVVLRADWDGQEEQIKQLREENKQLRKDKESLNKEVDTWANKARLSDRKCEEIESQLRALENDKNNRDKAVTIIDQVETIHKIVLQLRKKYLS